MFAICNHSQKLTPNPSLAFMKPRLLLALLLPALVLSARADVTVLSEDFEGVFPGEWSVGVAGPGKAAATWQTVNSSFGGIGTHGGQGKCFCAGTSPNSTCGTVDFRTNPIKQDEDVSVKWAVSWSNTVFYYRSDGPAGEITSAAKDSLRVSFVPRSTGRYTLTVTHLTSADSGSPGGGYSPVTIAVNGTNLVACYDPASHHGGTHGFVTDSWSFDATAGVQASITWSLCGDWYTFYWIQQLAITGPTTDYQDNMAAFMQRAINLTGCTNASLSFWHRMPSLDEGYDVGRVLVDETEIWHAGRAVGSWTLVQLPLTSFTGAWHILRFEFDSDDSVWGQGWYLDDIQVTSSSTPSLTNAPMVFAASDFPNQTGAYYRAYYTTNATPNATNWTARSGPGQRWDFSQPQQTTEIIQRMDVVPPADGDWYGDFPYATYAERTTTESSGDQSWSFYSLTNGAGRYYHGFNHPIDDPIYPVIVFSPTVRQFPDPLRFGQAWHWDTAFVSEYQSTFELSHLTTFAMVDGYGTMRIQGGVELPTLRVKELALQTVSIGGSNVVSASSTNYWWLVRGVGLAGQIACPSSNIPAGVPSLRVFEAGEFTDLLPSVRHLRLCLSGSRPVLSWDPVATTNGYRIEFSDTLPAANWQLLDLPTGTAWTNASPVAGRQGFFRVLARP